MQNFHRVSAFNLVTFELLTKSDNKEILLLTSFSFDEKVSLIKYGLLLYLPKLNFNCAWLINLDVSKLCNEKSRVPFSIAVLKTGKSESCNLCLNHQLHLQPQDVSVFKYRLTVYTRKSYQGTGRERLEKSLSKAEAI